MGKVLWAMVVLWGCLVSVSAAQVSPLNLAPGYPTQLDDAYPINPGNVAVQGAFRFDKMESEEARLRQTLEARWGVMHGVELFASGTTTWGPLQPGTVDDPRAVRVGLLYRLTTQQESIVVLPSVAVRSTVQVPVTGSSLQPSLRLELLGSWELGHEWWVHANTGVQVSSERRLGLQSVGQPTIWYGRVGVVRGLMPNLGLVGNVTYGQDPTAAGAYVWTPEVGLAWGMTQDWILTVGGGHDFGSSPQKATVRGNMGLSWVW
jgi:hypothetical protein